MRPVIRSFLLMSRKHRVATVLLVTVRSLANGLDVLGIAAVGFLGSMIATDVAGSPRGNFLGLEYGSPTTTAYVLTFSVVIGAFIVKSVLGASLLRATTALLARFESNASTEIARWLFGGDIERFRRYSRSELQWTVTDSSHLAFSTLIYAGASLVTEGALFLAVFLGFILVDWSSALVVAVYFFLILGFFQLVVSRRVNAMGQRMAERKIEAVSSVLETVESFRQLAVLERRHLLLDKFSRARSNLAHDHGLQRFLLGLPRFIFELALVVGILLLVLWQFFLGDLAEGLIIAGVFLAGGFRIMAAILPLQNAFTDIRTAGPQAQRAQNLLEKARSVSPFVASLQTVEPAETGFTGRDVSRPSIGMSLKLRDVWLTHSSPSGTVEVLRGINLDLNAGGFLAVVGPSGAGKSSLADLILGVQEATSGFISLDGLSPLEQRRSETGSISYVPQKTGLITGSLAVNIALEERKEEIDPGRLARAVELSGLTSFVQDLPEGIDTLVSPAKERLSGGQMQRLAIARALYTQPRLVVLDEATSALDAETEDFISRGIEALVGQTTIVVIAHRLSTIQRADLVLALDEGKVQGVGTFAEVRRNVPFLANSVRLLNIPDNG